MKILIIHNQYQHHGGEDNVVSSEKKMLENFGHEVVLYKRSNMEINKYSIFQKIKFVLKDLYWSDQVYQELSEIIKKEKPDIAHFHNTFLVISPSAYQVCYDLDIPIVQSLHNYRFLCPMGTFTRDGKFCEDCLKYGRRSAVIHRCWRKSHIKSFMLVRVIVRIYKKLIFSKYITKYIALSNFAKEKFIVNGYDAKKISIKPNFLDFDPGVGSKKGDYGIFVGGLHPWKGVTVLLKAWKALPKKYPLKVIGAGPLEDQVLDAAQDLNIQYLGQKPLKETIEQIRHALFVIVSSECYETCPRVIIEAYSCGVPVIASNTGPIKELIEEGKTGILFDFGDFDDLQKKAHYLFENREKVEEMGVHARKHYERRFAMKENYNKIIDIYNEAIELKKEELVG